MSFTSEIKQEVAYNELKECCSVAELSALIKLSSSLVIGKGGFSLAVRLENPTAMKRVVYLLKKLYGTETELEIAQKTNLKKNNVYRLRFDNGKEILEKLGLYSNKGLLNHPSYQIVSKECCGRAYLAGCFLAYGACNSPNKPNYHLEISINDIEHANFVVKLLSRYDLNAKISKRRNKYVVYMKKADSISDFLRLIGAHESLMNFENSRINRDFKNSLTRLDNCEIANEIKSLSAAKRQVESIQKIYNNNKTDALDEKLRNVMEIRMKYQDYSLLELCDEYQKAYGELISKSGLKHRLNKIESYAKEL